MLTIMKTTANKKIMKFSALAIAFSGLIISCDDYLDIEPPSSVSPESYLVDADQLGAYTIRYYSDNFTSINNLYGADNATDN